MELLYRNSKGTVLTSVPTSLKIYEMDSAPRAFGSILPLSANRKENFYHSLLKIRLA